MCIVALICLRQGYGKTGGSVQHWLPSWHLLRLGESGTEDHGGIDVVFGLEIQGVPRWWLGRRVWRV
jgi:hypothetical protein